MTKDELQAALAEREATIAAQVEELEKLRSAAVVNVSVDTSILESTLREAQAVCEQAARERDEALAARAAVAAELTAAREQLRPLAGLQAQVEQASAEAEALRVQLDALRAENPTPAPLTPTDAVKNGLAELLTWHGIEDPEGEAGRVCAHLIDYARHSGRLPETTTRALMTLI